MQGKFKAGREVCGEEAQLRVCVCVCALCCAQGVAVLHVRAIAVLFELKHVLCVCVSGCASLIPLVECMVG